MRGDWCELPRSNVKLEEKLGEGTFGEVYKGVLKIKDEVTLCAVKKLKGNYCYYYYNYYCRRCLILQHKPLPWGILLEELGRRRCT